VCVLCCVSEDEGTCVVYFVLFFILLVLIFLEFDNIFSFFCRSTLFLVSIALMCNVKFCMSICNLWFVCF
jgi:hypothetical protein